ncbi:MAG TPA: hypothetical protein VGS57_17180 [Thermoanaerobaculia bacterium]|jgi:hypothetical protein|nr:hypothetical protein [Thermoanaerobaculia bacterium]
MKTIFYNRTPYHAAQLTVPDCFIALDEIYDLLVPDMESILGAPYLQHAENICRRMGDIDLYALFIRDADAHADPFWAATIISSYLVGFFSACKSLFDAASICLTDLHRLALTDREQDMSRGRFWNTLQATSSASFTKFKSFRSLCDEVVRWRDASVHRSTPLVLVHSPGYPDDAPRSEITIRMVATPGATPAAVVSTGAAVPWLGPLELHDRWRPHLISLCVELCSEIQGSLGPSTA